MKPWLLALSAGGWSAVVCSLGAAAQLEVREPAGAIPLLKEVDVVVVGGSSGGVAAAAEAARAGAKVFLAAPRPYLGEDLCAHYRLWLEPGEAPMSSLASEVYSHPPPVEPVGAGLKFSYKASVASARVHPDTSPPSLLSDGKWHSAANQSVQFDADVVLDLDLGEVSPLARLHLMAYQRNNDFELASVLVSLSPDGSRWRRMPELRNEQLGQGQFEQGALIISGPLEGAARYLRLELKRGPEARRLLLGEIVVQGTASTAAVSRAAGPRAVTPMHVKRTLDNALIRSGVSFLCSSYCTDVLRDNQGRLAGVVVGNRSGRQAIVAKAVIDATDRGLVARLAGAAFEPYPAGTARLQRVVVGGQPRQGESVMLRPRDPPVAIQDRKGDWFPVHEYELQMTLRDASFASWAEAEQWARDWTWTRESEDASEMLFQVPPDRFHSRQGASGSWEGPERVPLSCLQPAGVDRLYVLNGCADMPREAAARLVRPVNLMAVGERLGRAVAVESARQPGPEGVRVPGRAVEKAVLGEARQTVAEGLARPAMGQVPAEAGGLPILGEYDVVVVGGGTGGAPAGIGAGRQGVRTLVLEYLHGLGGVGTLGLISSYYHGNRVGFTREVDEGVAAFGSSGQNRTSSASWVPDWKSEWYRQALRKTGVDIWYGVLGAGAVVEGQRVKGVIVLTPQGRGVVLAKVVVDATGNADIAAAAGAVCRYTDAMDVAVQGAGLPPRELGARYTNTDYTFVDDTDIFDLWRVLTAARQKFKAAYDLGQLVDTRERRQIVGDFTLSPMDMMLGRTFPDTIVIARSNFDTHGYIVHPMFMIRPPHREDLDVRVPLRCLLPRGLEGLLVTGLGVSAHRDALPVIRMQADVQNQGYAAGVAAAMAAKQGIGPRQLNVRQLQQHLVEKGILPPAVLTEGDSFPLPRERLEQAVKTLPRDYEGLEVLLAHWELAGSLVKQAMAEAAGESARLAYAHLLGMMGDPAGADILAKAVANAPWDKGWRYTGMGQFGASMSPLDSLVVALGRTRSPLALEPLLEKAAQLTPQSEFSHYRALALALESLRDKSAARPLARLLRQPGIAGHHVGDIHAPLRANPPSGTDTTTRNQALTELYLARALYRCGDFEGLGEKTLRAYAQDLHGHYARHARAVLESR